MSKVLVKRFVFDKDLSYIKKNSYEIVICQEWKSQEPMPVNISVKFSEEFRVEGTHLTYKKNTQVIDSLFHKVGQFLVAEDINLKPALRKLIYWSNYKIGALKYMGNLWAEGNTIIDKTSYFEDSYLKSILKYCRQFYKNLKLREANGVDQEDDISGKYKIGILINSQFEYNLYKNIIDELENENLIVFHYGNLDPQSFNKSCKHVNIKSISGSKQIWINPFRLNKEELNALNTIYKDYVFVSNELKAYKKIKSFGISKLLINEGENLAHRNLLKSVLGNQVTIYNTMNGLKAGEAQDADVSFDKWFVWDEEMKEFMAQKTKLNRSMFLVSGHLAKDVIRCHGYKNTLQLSDDIKSNKIVVAIFTVRGTRPEKMDTINEFVKICSDNDGIFSIIKTHPLEAESDFIYSGFDQNRSMIVPDMYKNSKQVLYDILKDADLCIAFNSTIGLECKWLQIPCINVEYREKSVLYLNDQQYIYHVKNKQEIRPQILELLKKRHVDDDLKIKDKVYLTIANALRNGDSF